MNFFRCETKHKYYYGYEKFTHSQLFPSTLAQGNSMDLKSKSQKCKHLKKKPSAKGLTISISSGIPTHQDTLPPAPDEINDLPKPTATAIHPLLPPL